MTQLKSNNPILIATAKEIDKFINKPKTSEYTLAENKQGIFYTPYMTIKKWVQKHYSEEELREHPDFAEGRFNGEVRESIKKDVKC